MKRLLRMGCALYLLTGVAHVVLGAILPELLAHYGLDYKHGGLLIFLQFFGFLIGVITMPKWASFFGRRGLLLVALISLFVAQVIYSILPPWHWMIIAAPFAGIGFGAIEAAISSLIIEFTTDKKAIAISKVEVFFGIGALLMPMIAAFFIYIGQWQLSFPLIALYTLILAIIWGVISFEELNEHFKRVSKQVNSAIVRKTYSKDKFPILILFALFFLIYVGVEMSYVNFLPSMMIENNIATDATATMSVTFFWSTMIVGRMFAGIIAEKITYARYLIYGTTGSLVFLIIFAFTTELWSTYLIILCVGLFMSGLFAIALVAANQALPGMTMQTTSTVVAAGGVGGALFPLLTGWSMDIFPLFITKWMLIIFTFLMVVIAIAAIRKSNLNMLNN